MRVASPAAMRKVSISRVTSPRASLDRLAGLDAQCEREFLLALLETAHAMFEHVAACIRRERRHRSARIACAAAIALRTVAASAKATRVRRLAGVFVQHLEIGVGGDRLIGEVVGIGAV